MISHVKMCQNLRMCASEAVGGWAGGRVRASEAVGGWAGGRVRAWVRGWVGGWVVSKLRP